MRASRVALALFVLAVACKAPTSETSEIAGARNTCVDDAGCPTDSTCVDRTCLALPPSSLQLVAEITPAATSGLTPVPRFLTLPQLQSQRTFFEGLDDLGNERSLLMPALVSRTFALKDVPPELLLAHPSCSYSQVPLVANLAAGGIYRGVAPGVTGRFDADRKVTLIAQELPRDLYVRPEAHATPGEPCQVTPFLVRNATEASALPAVPSQLRLRILVAQTALLDGYRAEILDQATGLRVSTMGKLYAVSDTELRAGVLEPSGVGPIDYFSPLPSGGFWLLLSPPPGAVGPKLAFDASFFSDDETVLDLSTLAVTMTKVEARLVTPGPVEGSLVGAPGTLVVRARGVSPEGAPGIDGIPPGVLAWFEAEVTADPATGIASFSAPAGVYDATALGGADGGIVRATAPWEIRRPKGQSQVFGLALTVPPRAELTLEATAVAQRAERVGVQWTPVPQAKAPLDVIFRAAPLSLRRGGSTTDGSGRLVDALDQGTYDLTVRFDPRSGLPWIVAHDLDVTSSRSLTLDASPPFEVRGRVLVPEAGVPPTQLLALGGGTVRILAKRGERLVPVGMSSIDATGAFRAFVPSYFAE